MNCIMYYVLLSNKAFNIAKNLKYERHQRELASMIYTFFGKKTSGGDITENEELAKELYLPNIRKFEKQKVYYSFKDNIFGTDFADMQLISKFNKRISFLLCVNDIFRKYVLVIRWKDKTVLELLTLFK